jgi:hypothetical protein
MTEFDGAMKRLLAAALLAPVITIGVVTACSNSHSGSQAAPSNQASAAGQGAAVAVRISTDAEDACQDMEAQAFLAKYAENDFMQAFSTQAPDYDAKRVVFVVAAKNAVQKVADGLPSNVPDPPVSAIRQWMEAERAYINATETQGLEDIYHAYEGTIQAFNAAQEACSSVQKFQ